MSVRTEPAVDVSLYSLLGFAAADHRPDRATDALIFNLVAQQPRAGNRHINVPRPPIEDGDFSRTALAIRPLAAYAPPGRGGVSHLLSTQRADGSWPVRSRALKFQPYFDGGFPYEHDQWISAMATGWATAAVALGLETPVSETAARSIDSPR
jgi:hypothetical protein